MQFPMGDFRTKFGKGVILYVSVGVLTEDVPRPFRHALRLSVNRCSSDQQLLKTMVKELHFDGLVLVTGTFWPIKSKVRNA